RPSHRKSPCTFIRSLPRLYQAGESSAPSLSQTTGFCEQAVSGTETVLGTIHFTKICSTGRATSRNPKMHRLAHVSSHVFDAAEKRGYGIQSDAGTVAVFDSAINLGCVYPGNHSCETCSSGSGLVLGFFTRREWSVTIVVRRCCSA